MSQTSYLEAECGFMQAATDSDLVERIYAGATTPERLKLGLQCIVERLGASGGNIHVVDKATSY